MKMISLFISFVILASCQIEVKPIHYGLDNCGFCHMTITDKRYGTETITEKGKVYKFDSIECLIDFEKEEKISKFGFFITDYNNPGVLINAANTYVLKSTALKSPMGRNLTGFSTLEAAKKFQKTPDDKILTFSEALNEF